MAKYPRQDDSFFGLDSTFLGWSLIVVGVLAGGSFLLGMYYGYNQGYSAARKAFQSDDRQTSVEKEVDKQREEKSSSDTESFNRVITSDDLNQSSESSTSASSMDKKFQKDQNTSNNQVEESRNKDRRRITSENTEQENTEESTDDAESESSADNDDETSSEHTPITSENQAISGDQPNFAIQVFSSQRKSRAVNRRDELQKEDIEASLTEKMIDGKQWYRIRVENFTSKELAVQRAEELKQDGLIDDYWISRISS